MPMAWSQGWRSRAAAQHLRALIKGIAQLLGCLLHLPNLGAADIAFAVEDV